MPAGEYRGRPRYEHVTVEARAIGVIIGPGGATIRALMEASGARIEIDPSTIDYRDSREPQKVAVSGPAPAVRAAKAAIKELASKGYTSLTQEKGFTEGRVQVPPSQLHEVIGKGGAVIRTIQDRLGVRLNVPKTQGAPVRGGPSHLRPKPVAVGVAGPKEAVAQAKDVIKALLRWHHHEVTHPGCVHAELDVPPAYLSFVIGVKGAELRHIQANFGVDVHVPSKDGPTDFVLIVGPPSNVARAKEYVLKLMVKADERSSRGQTEEY